MKIWLAVLLAGTMIISLPACGEKKDAGSANTKTEVTAEKADFESFSVEAVDYYLKNKVNLSVDAVKPDWEYTVGEYEAYGDEPDSSIGHAVIKFTKADGEVTEDEYKAWAKKVFDATASVSQDGHNVVGYEFVGDGEDALAEVTLDDALDGFLTGWAFKYDDQLMVVYVTQEYDNDKESEIGSIFYYDGVKMDIGRGLQKDFDDTLQDAEDYLS